MHEVDVLNILVGLSLEDAEEIASLYGYTVRIVSINNTPTICTRDVRPERINVALDSNNFITEVKGTG